MTYRPAAMALLLYLAFSVSALAQPPVAEPEGRRVYVPVEDLDVVLEHDKQGVVLPRAEFLKLSEDAKKQLDNALTSTHAVVVSRAVYAARTVDNQIVVSATIELNQLARGWHTVMLPFSGLAVEGATLDDKPAEIGRGSGDGRPLVLFTHQPGQHTLKLELSGPLVNIGSDQSAGFGVPAISPASLQMTLPAGKHLHVNETPLERPAAADQPANYNVPVGGKTSIALRITDRRSQQESASLVFAGTAIGLYVAPEERTWRAVTSLNVFGKPIDSLTFTIPKSLEIVSVESTGLERWEIGEGTVGNTTTLKLVYRQPFNESRTVTFSGVSASVLGQPWSVPNLSLASATSHLVRVVVQHPAGLRLHEVETTGIRRVSADDAAAAETPGESDMLVKVGAGQVLHYAAWRENFALLFVTQPRARELQATIATRVDVTSHELSLRASIAVQSRFAPLFDFDLALPVDWSVTDVLFENRPIAWRIIPVGAELNQVRIAFNPPIPADGKANLTLAARMNPVENLPIEDQPLSIKLPEVTLPQVGVTDGRYMIAADDDLDLATEEISGLDPARLTAAEQQAPRAPRLVYEYQDTRFTGTIKITRKPVRVAAQTLAYHRLDRETLISHLEARMVVQGGGLQKLQVALPETAGTNLRFSLLQPPNEPQAQLPRITEQTSTPPANGERVWTLQLDQRAFGLLWLVVDLTAPRTADAKTFVLPGLVVTSADRQNGFVAVEAGPDQQLDVAAVDAAGQPLVEVDPADVPAPLGYVPQERIVAAYRAIRPGFRIVLTETRFDRQAVPTALCDIATLTTVLGEGGQQQHKAEFRLRAVGVQSLQVALPEGAVLWATSVAGKPVEVRKETPPKPGWIVPLPQVTNPAEQILIELFYRTSGGSLTGTGRLRQEPPRIKAIGGRGDEEPIEILAREWLVYHPYQTEFTASTGQFEPVEKPSRASFLGALHHSLSYMSPRDLWQKAVAAGVVGGMIFIVFFAYRRRGALAATLTVLGGSMLLLVYIVSSFTNLAPRSVAYFSKGMTDLEQSSDKVWDEERYGRIAVRDPLGAMDGQATSSTDARYNAEIALDRYSKVPVLGQATAPPAAAMPPGTTAGAASTPFPPAPEAMPQDAEGLVESKDQPATDAGGPAFSRPQRAMGGFRGDAGRQKDGAMEDFKQNQELSKREGVKGTKNDSAPNKSDNLGGQRSSESDSGNRKPGNNGLPNTFGQPVGPFGGGQSFAFGTDKGSRNLADNRLFESDEVAGLTLAQGSEQSRAEHLARGANALGAQSSLKGALLSLAIDLPVPLNTRQTQFRYSGSPAGDAKPTLEVEYQNRRDLWFVSFAWQAGMLLLFWFARKWSAGVRAALGVLGLLAPLALVAVVSIDVLPYLDGLFIGSLWGLLLWGLLAICSRIKQASSSHIRITTLPLVLFALACGFATERVQAQEVKSQAAGDAQAASAARVKSLAPTIVVPYEPGEDPLQSARVFLPWEKFLELWNAAHPDQAIESPAPADGLVAEALYAVQLAPPAAGKAPLAEVTARFVLHSFVDDQVTIPLPIGLVAFEKAQLDGKSAALITRDVAGASELAIVVPARGVHVLDAKFTLRFEQTGAAGKLTLLTKPVPAGLLRLTLPEGDMNLRVTGGARTFRKLREANRTVALVPVDQGGEIVVAWTPAQVREAAQGIVHVESATAVSLGDAGLRINSSFKYIVRQGAISDVSYSLPPGILVRQIAGLDLGGWEIAGEGADRTLKVFLRRPVNDSTVVQFDLFVSQSFTEQTQPLPVPQFVPSGVTREIGTLGIYAEKQLSVTAGAATGLAQIDVGQFAAPPALTPPGGPAAAQAPTASAPLLAYRFAARPIQLQLLVARQKPQSKGTAEHAIVIGTRKQRMASRLELHLAGAPRSEITIKLPLGYLLYDLKSNDSVDYHVEPRPGEPNDLLIVELSAPRTGVVTLVLDGIVPRVPEDVAPQIAVPVPLEIGELRSSLAVWLDRIYTGTLDDISGWKSIDPATLPQRLRSVQNTAAQFAFTSNLTGLQPVGLTLNRAVPRLSADSLSVVIARDTSVQHLLYLRWQISAAGESTFVFTTPDWLADRLEFDRSTTGVRIRQVVSEKIPGNRLRWIVTLDDPRTTVATLIAQATLPPPDAGRIAAPVPLFEQATVGDNGPQYQPLDQQHQFIVLANQSPQRLEQITPDAVEAIPAVDLPIKISQVISDQAAEILRVRDTRAEIGWNAQGAQQHKSSAASVNLAKMTLVVAHDGSWRGLAHYRINNRSRQFLALRMPAKSRILSLFVADRASRPIDPKRPSEPNLVLIPLPKTAAGDLSAEVKLVYAGRFDQPLPKGFQVLRTDLDLPAPQVLSQTEDANYGIPVAATEWTVILPPDVDAQRIEDAARSNVAESEAGVEEQIAEYNEWLNLSVIALDSSGSMKGAKDRAMNNLKQMKLPSVDLSSRRAGKSVQSSDSRQEVELEQLQTKVQEVQQKLQTQKAGGKSTGGEGIEQDHISNTVIQRELITGNTADFAVSENKPGEDSDDVLSFTVQTPPAEKSADSKPHGQAAAKSVQKKSGANRGELRRQTASQSTQLNLEGQMAGEQAQAANQSAKPRDDLNRVDADKLLDLSNSAVVRDGTSNSFARPQNATGMGPRYGDVVGLLPSGGAGGAGGGFGGAGQPGMPTFDDVLGVPAIDALSWSKAGGLSLAIDIPQDGQKLTFSKSGGDARLALGLRPRASLEVGFGLGWAAVWLLVALGLIAALGRADASAALGRKLPLIAVGVGLAWYFLLPAAPIGFMLFLLGAVMLGWQHRRATVH